MTLLSYMELKLVTKILRHGYVFCSCFDFCFVLFTFVYHTLLRHDLFMYVTKNIVPVNRLFSHVTDWNSAPNYYFFLFFICLLTIHCNASIYRHVTKNIVPMPRLQYMLQFEACHWIRRLDSLNFLYVHQPCLVMS